MANAVSICNLALSFLGDDASVMSIDPPDGSAQAQLCSTMYPVARARLLEIFDWTFATKRAALAKLAQKETHGWAGVYSLPSDCVRAIRVRDSGFERCRPLPHGFPVSDPMRADVRFLVEGRLLYTDAPNPVLTYLSSNVSESTFTPGFVEALAYALASMMAGARVKGKEGQILASDLQKRYVYALSVAKTSDANAQGKRIDFVPAWIGVR